VQAHQCTKVKREGHATDIPAAKRLKADSAMADINVDSIFGKMSDDES